MSVLPKDLSIEDFDLVDPEWEKEFRNRLQENNDNQNNNNNQTPPQTKKESESDVIERMLRRIYSDETVVVSEREKEPALARQETAEPKQQQDEAEPFLTQNDESQDDQPAAPKQVLDAPTLKAALSSELENFRSNRDLSASRTSLYESRTILEVLGDLPLILYPPSVLKPKPSRCIEDNSITEHRYFVFGALVFTGALFSVFF